MHKACLAVSWAMLLLRLLFERSQITVTTDHGALERLVTMSDESRKLARWRLRLSQFVSDKLKWSGVKNQATIVLLRLLNPGIDKSTLHDRVLALSINTETFKIVYEFKIEHEEEEEAEDCTTWHEDFVPCLP